MNKKSILIKAYQEILDQQQLLQNYYAFSPEVLMLQKVLDGLEYHYHTEFKKNIKEEINF